jgi:hypothetical protein
VFGKYGETAVYIPALMLSAAAELRSCQNGEEGLVKLPCWGNVSEMDERFATHQWAKKTDVKLIPAVAAPPARNIVRIPARRQVVEPASTTPPKAGPSKRAATASPSPNRKGNKRVRATSHPTAIIPTPRKRSKFKPAFPVPGSEKGAAEQELVKEKGKAKGRGKAMAGDIPPKVSFKSVDFTHSISLQYEMVIPSGRPSTSEKPQGVGHVNNTHACSVTHADTHPGFSR